MNTFLPYPDFNRSAKVLDRARLGKQRSESLTILQYMLGSKVEDSKVVEFDKSPTGAAKLCVKMWDATINAFGIYTLVMCREWKGRGYQDNVGQQVKLLIPGIEINWTVKFPIWLGDDTVHASHRSNLLRKDPLYYGMFGWTEPNNLPYVWPSGV